MLSLVIVSNMAGTAPESPPQADAPLVPDVLPRPDQLDVTDRALVARCADGDIAALESLFGRHGDTLWGCAEVASRRAGSPGAESLVSGAFVALWDSARAVLAGRRSVEAALVAATDKIGAPRHVVLVTHQPLVSELVDHFLGAGNAVPSLTPGGFASLELDLPAPACATLVFWAVAPEYETGL